MECNFKDDKFEKPICLLKGNGGLMFQCEGEDNCILHRKDKGE